jgi:hypothetical protein
MKESSCSEVYPEQAESAISATVWEIRLPQSAQMRIVSIVRSSVEEGSDFG